MFRRYTHRRRGILPRIRDDTSNYNISSFNYVSPNSIRQRELCFSPIEFCMEVLVLFKQHSIGEKSFGAEKLSDYCLSFDHNSFTVCRSASIVLLFLMTKSAYLIFSDTGIWESILACASALLSNLF